MATRTVNAYIFVDRDGEELEVEVTGTYQGEEPTRYYPPPGDPGYPDTVEDVEAFYQGKPFGLTVAEERYAEGRLLEAGREPSRDELDYDRGV